jgi:hypothetical protein
VHRSRLTAIGIDVPSGTHETEAEFWAAVVGGAVERREDPNDPNMTVGRPRGLELFVQRIDDHEPRVHLDVETDDVEAEVVRLEKLGAQRVQRVRTWWIMRDPAGVVFCVVAPQGGDFPVDASTWD